MRGIRGEWPLLDDGYITVFEFTLYGLDCRWIVENHSVEPDIKVDDLPVDLMRDYDAQLYTAVDYLMKKIKPHPLHLPPPPPLIPAYPPPGHDCSLRRCFFDIRGGCSRHSSRCAPASRDTCTSMYIGHATAAFLQIQQLTGSRVYFLRDAGCFRVLQKSKKLLNS